MHANYFVNTGGATAADVRGLIEHAQRVVEEKFGVRLEPEVSSSDAGGGGSIGTAMTDYFVHESSYVDDGAVIGRGTKIWHFSHIMPGAVIGERCNLGQNVVVMPGTRLGNNVKVQNNVSIYEGVVLEDDVFCGPSCVFTNVVNPRSHVSRKSEYQATLVRRGARSAPMPPFFAG